MCKVQILALNDFITQKENMNIKRIRCILTGGCKFKGGTTQCHLNDNDVVTITETCCKCGKQYSFSAPYKAFEECAEEIHEQTANS